MNETFWHGLSQYRRMSNAFFVLLCAAVLLLVVMSLSTLKEMSTLGRAPSQSGTISVSGTGDVIAVPTIAEFTFSVSADAPQVADAQKAATTLMNSALAKLKENGVAENDIKTVDYSIYPRYEYVQLKTQIVCAPGYCPPSDTNRQLAGYTVNQTVSVKVRDTAKAGTVLASIGQTGVTNVSGLNFTVDDEEALIAEARKKAIDDAKQKAEKLAGDLGVNLGRIVSYGDSGNYPMPMYYKGAGLTAQDSAVSNPAPSLPVGENKITSNVNIVYELQ